MTRTAEIPTCRKCGSPDVKADAWAYFDPCAEIWDLHSTYEENSYCDSCEQETKLKWIEVELDEKLNVIMPEAS